MKFILRSTVSILLAVALLFFLRQSLIPKPTQGEYNQIFIFNWGDYIDPFLIEQFEEETGYQVVYETFDSNEAMISKIEQGATHYDLAFPSDYAVSHMIDKDLLIEFDHKKIEGLDSIDPRFLDQAFDPGNRYSIPYFWGSLGILYNRRDVNVEDIETWDHLWNPQFKEQIIMVDGARELLGLSLQSMGYSLNETHPHILLEAANKLDQLMPNIKAILLDEIKMYMVQEEASLAVTYSGEAGAAILENEDLAYHIPEDGSNIWFDNMVIPRTAQNIDAAYAFINFMLRPEVAAQNAEYIMYSSPNQDALALLDEEIRENEMYYPSDEVIQSLELYEDLGQKNIILYNDLFLELKISPRLP